MISRHAEALKQVPYHDAHDQGMPTAPTSGQCEATVLAYSIGASLPHLVHPPLHVQGERCLYMGILLEPYRLGPILPTLPLSQATLTRDGPIVMGLTH